MKIWFEVIRYNMFSSMIRYNRLLNMTCYDMRRHDMKRCDTSDTVSYDPRDLGFSAMLLPLHATQVMGRVGGVGWG